MLPPPAMLARLDRHLPLLVRGPRDQPDRQRTLRGAIAWSYDLLDEAERLALRRLAVFAYGVPLDGAEAALPGGEARPDAVELLASLVDKSLMERIGTDEGDGAGRPRFAMLTTIREYVRELLPEAEEVGARDAHAAFVARLVSPTMPRVAGPR